MGRLDDPHPSPSDSRILDVGTGDGALLTALSAAGYRNLTGIDPFMEPRDDPENGVRTFRRTMEDEHGTYDIVMLHHSLEHMPDPAAAMQHVRRLVHPGGWALVRMPVAGSTAGARTASTGSAWSLRATWSYPASRACAGSPTRPALTSNSIAFDSSGCCYAVSELWASDRVLPYPRRPWQKRAIEMCGAERVSQLQRLSRERNSAGDGDHAAYYLRLRA